MANLLCTLFGHRPEGPGWWGDVPYCDPQFHGLTDGVGRMHGYLRHECKRCGTKYVAARLHINHPTILRALSNTEGK